MINVQTSSVFMIANPFLVRMKSYVVHGFQSGVWGLRKTDFVLIVNLNSRRSSTSLKIQSVQCVWTPKLV